MPIFREKGDDAYDFLTPLQNVLFSDAANPGDGVGLYFHRMNNHHRKGYAMNLNPSDATHMGKGLKISPFPQHFMPT